MIHNTQSCTLLFTVAELVVLCEVQTYLIIHIWSGPLHKSNTCSRHPCRIKPYRDTKICPASLGRAQFEIKNYFVLNSFTTVPVSVSVLDTPPETGCERPQQTAEMTTQRWPGSGGQSQNAYTVIRQVIEPGRVISHLRHGSDDHLGSGSDANQFVLF